MVLESSPRLVLPLICLTSPGRWIPKLSPILSESVEPFLHLSMILRVQDSFILIKIEKLHPDKPQISKFMFFLFLVFDSSYLQIHQRVFLMFIRTTNTEKTICRWDYSKPSHDMVTSVGFLVNPIMRGFTVFRFHESSPATSTRSESVVV